MSRTWLPFFAIAVAFITIGFNGRHAYIYIGVAFLIIALLHLLRSRE